MTNWEYQSDGSRSSTSNGGRVTRLGRLVSRAVSAVKDEDLSRYIL